MLPAVDDGASAPEGEAPSARPAEPDNTAKYMFMGPAADKKPKHHAHRKARIEHKIPGRIRMKIPSARGNPALLDAYCVAFSSIPGIDKVKAKPETGSLVIHYDPKREKEFEKTFAAACEHHSVAVASRPGDEISEMAAKLEAEANFLAERSEIAKATVDFFKGFDKQLKLATDNTIDLKIVLAGGLAAFTFLEIGAEAATPMWVTLALFSLNHFAELQHAPIQPEEPEDLALAR